MSGTSTDPNDTPRKQKRQSGCRFAWVVLLMLLLVAAVELFARYGLGLGDPPLSMPHPTTEYIFRPNATYHRFGNKVHYNAYSMRSDNFPPTKHHPRELRVMMLGDSVINGGNLTDQAELASQRLQHMLGDRLGRPVVVGNISAGSWGPGNLDGYVKLYGMFDADLAIIVLNSEDWTDVRTFEPTAGVSPAFPTETPQLALQEGVFRYLPRYLPKWADPGAYLDFNDTPQFAAHSPRPGWTEPANSGPAFRSLIKRIQRKQIPVVVLQHAREDELGGDWQRGHQKFRQIAEEMGAAVVQLRPALRKAVNQGSNPYRDPIHLNAVGQRVLAERVLQIVLNHDALGINKGPTTTKGE
jgi:hypothetical protein